MAHITVIPKKGKDPSQCPSYHPILANRLLTYIPSLIHPDQVGFIPNREGRENTQRVLSAIHFSQIHQKPLVLVSADAEKAFDRVDWTYLKAMLQHIGMRKGMQNWITSLYSYLKAQVKINIISEPFSICNGTR